MPRNGSGTSSVVNSFTPFTVADANDVNENFDDVADQLTNSLPRDGQAGMTGQLKADDGTVSLPGITFTNDLDTGVRRVGANKLAIVTAGADKLTFDAFGPIATLLKGHLWGLKLSNNVSDAVNDIDIAVGQAASDSTVAELMTLGTAITKRLDAGWAVGTNQGGLDTGAVADSTYHVWLIQRSDTGVVDVLFSLSATAPTMPTNYDRKRRIGSVLRSAGTILGFTHVGKNTFVLNSTFTMRSSTAALATSLLAFATPGGIQTEPLITVSVGINANSTGITNFGSAAVGTTTTTVHTLSGSSATTVSSYTPGGFLTNTAQQIYANVTISVGTLTSHVIGCAGWIDTFL